MIEWRPYQTEVIEAVFSDWLNHDSVLVVAATGSGKTNMLWGIAVRYIEENTGARICILAHRKELIEQPLARLEEFWPQHARRAGIVMADTNDCHRQFVIATVQTLGSKSGKRINEMLRYGKIDLLIIDESHHATANQYRNVIDHLKKRNPALKILGVTATPERADKKNLTEIFEKESANIGVAKLIEDGWLCRPTFHGVKTNIELSGVGVQGSGANRDYNQQQLVAAVETEDFFKIVVKTHLEKIGHRPTVAFVPSVAGAYRLAEMLSVVGVKAVAADGTTAKGERTAILNGFRSGSYTTLINVQLWTEGLDLPEIECIHMARPTKSDSLYLQIVGRALRNSPGKEQAEIFDYQPLDYRNFNQRLRMFQPKKKMTLMERNGSGGVEAQPKPRAGDQIEYTMLEYFGKQKAAWVETASGLRLIGLGKAEDGIERSLAVTADGGQLWAVWRKSGERWHQAKVIVNGSFDEVAAKSAEFVEKYGGRHTDKSAWWRRQSPSEKQIDFARQIGVWQDGMKAGQVSDAINEKLVTQAVLRQTRQVAA